MILTILAFVALAVGALAIVDRPAPEKAAVAQPRIVYVDNPFLPPEFAS